MPKSTKIQESKKSEELPVLWLDSMGRNQKGLVPLSLSENALQECLPPVEGLGFMRQLSSTPGESAEASADMQIPPRVRLSPLEESTRSAPHALELQVQTETC